VVPTIAVIVEGDKVKAGVPKTTDNVYVAVVELEEFVAVIV
jgi:hypothetical protein